MPIEQGRYLTAMFHLELIGGTVASGRFCAAWRASAFRARRPAANEAGPVSKLHSLPANGQGDATQAPETSAMKPAIKRSISAGGRL